MHDDVKREDEAMKIRRQQDVLQIKQKKAYVSRPQGSDLAHQKKGKGNPIAEALIFLKGMQ